MINQGKYLQLKIVKMSSWPSEIHKVFDDDIDNSVDALKAHMSFGLISKKIKNLWTLICSSDNHLLFTNQSTCPQIAKT
jgi:hypothetical protein